MVAPFHPASLPTLTAFAIAAVVHAAGSVQPDAMLTVDGVSVPIAVETTANPQGGFNFDANHVDPSGAWTLLIDLVGDADPTRFASVTGIVQYVNTSGTTQDVEFTFDLPLCPQVMGESALSGSVTVKLTMNDDGGTLECLAGDALWSARTHAESAQDLYPGYFTLSGTGKGAATTSSAFGLPLPKVVDVNVGDSFGIRQSYSITPGEKARFTNFLTLTPTTAALEECNEFTGDLNSDGLVNSADLGLFLGLWGKTSTLGDFNHDGIVDSADLGMLMSAWTG